MSSILTDSLWDKLRLYARCPQTPVSLRQMVQFGHNPSPGTMIKATHFIRDELPIRLAHRVVELLSLPHNLSKMSSVKRVRDWYAESFYELINFPSIELPNELKLRERVSISTPISNTTCHSNINNNHNTTIITNTSNIEMPSSHRYYTYIDPNINIPPNLIQYNQDFVKLIDKIKKRHDPVVTTIAQGIKELKLTRGLDNIDAPVQSFLDRFYLSRIGIRMLIGQHVALSQQKQPNNNNNTNNNKNYVGIICTHTNIAHIIQEAVDNARFICEDYYALYSAPQIQIYCPDDISFMYVPSHLHHCVFEVTKNSLRAVVERFGPDADHYPPIKIIVAQGKEDITIKISDEGGGIPRSGMPLIWTYLYTTADNQTSNDPYLSIHNSDFKAPLAGFGYGLPLSRLYARYFGGDLRLISMEGYGTDAYLHLSRLSDSEEPLP